MAWTPWFFRRRVTTPFCYWEYSDDPAYRALLSALEEHGARRTPETRRAAIAAMDAWADGAP